MQPPGIRRLHGSLSRGSPGSLNGPFSAARSRECPVSRGRPPVLRVSCRGGAFPLGPGGGGIHAVPNRSKTVLIVDDERDLRESIAELLEMSGYRVAQAANGLAALELLAAAPKPGMVLLDKMMPVMDGYEFLLQVRSDPAYRELPVLMMTADAGFRAPPETLGLLHKPLDLDKLLRLVGQHCPPT
ncbi:response regulator [Corallococcus exiguus]|nr:response regulator [Corallococcus exiguus]NPC70311.1 response regulator [Corallococcus exiguus]